MTFLRPADVRPAEKYFLNFVRADAVFDFNLINEPVFPDNFMELHQAYRKLNSLTFTFNNIIQHTGAGPGVVCACCV